MDPCGTLGVLEEQIKVAILILPHKPPTMPMNPYARGCIELVYSSSDRVR